MSLARPAPRDRGHLPWCASLLRLSTIARIRSLEELTEVCLRRSTRWCILVPDRELPFRASRRSMVISSSGQRPLLKQMLRDNAPRSFFPYAASRVSACRYLAATSATVSHSAAAYTAYHMVSCLAVTPPGLNSTSEPVELACINWAKATLFVFV